MQVEGSLTIFGVMAIAISYVLLLIAFTAIEEERMLYIMGGFAGILLGALLLGFAKIIRLQMEISKQLETLARFSRAQTKALNDFTAPATRGKKTAKTEEKAVATTLPSA